MNKPFSFSGMDMRSTEFREALDRLYAYSTRPVRGDGVSDTPFGVRIQHPPPYKPPLCGTFSGTANHVVIGTNTENTAAAGTVSQLFVAGGSQSADVWVSIGIMYDHIQTSPTLKDRRVKFTIDSCGRIVRIGDETLIDIDPTEAC